MSKIEVDFVTAEQIRCVEGPIELVDSNGQIVGVVRRPPTESEIERAKHRASRGGETLTWAQVRTKFRQEIGERPAMSFFLWTPRRNWYALRGPLGRRHR